MHTTSYPKMLDKINKLFSTIDTLSQIEMAVRYSHRLISRLSDEPGDTLGLNRWFAKRDLINYVDELVGDTTKRLSLETRGNTP